MVRELVLGLACLVALGACGETERDPKPSTASAGTSAGGGAGGSIASAGTPQQAGTGGAGGTAPFATAIAECVHYCETLDYMLPTALCEDWHLPEWDPQFCHIGPTVGCDDYCAKVYDTVKPACAETLPAVIRCVAPTYERNTLPSAAECLFGDCRDQLFTMTSACYGLREKLAAARAKWEQSGVTDYDLEYPLSENVRAKVAVRSGSEPSVTPPDAVAWTVPKLFDRVENLLDDRGSTAKADYDPMLGYVVAVFRRQGCSDASEGVGVVAVTPLVR